MPIFRTPSSDPKMVGHAAGARCRRTMRATLSAFVLLWVTGCSTMHYHVNAPLERYDPERGYHFAGDRTGSGAEDLFVVLAFSGGGTRAAAFAYGALEELARHDIVWRGARKRLIDEVDLVFGVSGGSMTAAYFALHGDRIFADFEHRFLNRNLQADLEDRAWSWGNLWRLASPRFGRADLLEQLLDEALFEGATFDSLTRRRKGPFAVISATDMGTGARFDFTQEYFDLLCSDLASFPIARAVAASSAVPIVLAPVTLWNYAGTCDFPAPLLRADAASAKGDADHPTRGARYLRDITSLLDRDRRPFVHLLDGGLADNLAIRGVLEPDAMLGSVQLARALRLERVSTVVFVIVNAETDPDQTTDHSADVPGLLDVARAIADIPINRNSFESELLFHSTFRRWQAQAEEAGRRTGAEPPRLYFVDVSLRAVEDATERAYLLGLPTTLHLPQQSVERLRRAAGRQMSDSADFRRLLEDLRD